MIDEPKPHRLLGAVIARGSDGWFFEMTGPIVAVASQRQAFEDWVRAVTFDDQGRPQWELPVGWQTVEAKAADVFANIHVPSPQQHDPLELAVSRGPLPTTADAAWLQRVNAWRTRLGLRAWSPSELAAATSELSAAPDASAAKVLLFNLTGTLRPSPQAAALAHGLGGSSDAAPAPSSASEHAPAKLGFTTPAGWQPGQLTISRGGFTIQREAVFNIARDGQQVEVTATRLPLGGGIAANVNRWRAQVGLPPVAEAELQSSLQPRTIAGHDAVAMELRGERQTVLGVIIPEGDQALFIKLQGDAALVEAEREHFDQFVTSLTLH